MGAALCFSYAIPSNPDTERYAVYSAYIEDGLTGESHSPGDPRGPVVIARDATMVGELKGLQRLRFTVGSLLNLQSRTTRPRRTIIFGLFLANLRTHTLERRFGISADYELLDSASLSSPNLNERLPRSYGYLTFSSIAFSPDLSDALFYTEHMCGLCGGGEFVLMRRVQGVWVVVDRYGTWIS